jgi:hypothetical protein
MKLYQNLNVTGSLTLTGSLNTIGTITATTLVVQTITSSVDFVTGSTRFGSILGNTHVFSGSVTMNPGGLFVSSSGIVGIGTSSPSVKLQVEDSSSTTLNTLYLVNSSTAAVTTKQNNLSFRMTDTVGTRKNAFQLTAYSDSAGGNIENGGLIFTGRKADVDTEYMRITSAGSVGIGTSSPDTLLQVAATGAAGISIRTNTSGDSFYRIYLDSTNYAHWYADRTNSKVTIGSVASVPLTFDTGGTERMRITSAGSVGIGTSSPTSTLSVATISDTSNLGSTGLTIGGASTLTSGNVLMLNFTPIGAQSGRARAGIGCLVGSDWGTGNLTFYTRAATDASVMTTADEKMRISSGGIVTIPYQPSFYVTSTAGLTDYTAGEVIIFNTARHNIGSCYNTSTGRFTAPVAGRYLLTVNVYTYASYTAAILLYINGGQYSVTDVQPYIYNSAAAGEGNRAFTSVWELSASDYIEVRARSTTRIYRAHSHFSGHLLS